MSKCRKRKKSKTQQLAGCSHSQPRDLDCNDNDQIYLVNINATV